MSITIDTSTNSDATATPAGQQVIVAPSDSALNALYYKDTSGPYLATAVSPYSSWATQGIGASTSRNSQSFVGHAGDDNLDLIVTSPANGPYYFTGTRSSNTWSLSAIVPTGDPNNASSDGISTSMWVGIDSQSRLWYIGIDDIGVGNWVVAAGYRSGGSWTIDSTIDGLVLGEHNQRGAAASLIGNYLVLIYDSGAGGLKYRRVDVHNASLGTWSAAASVGSVADVTTASTLSLRAIPGDSTGMLLYSGGNGISALKYDSGADSWGTATVLSASTNDRHPTLIPGASGTVYAVWCQYATTNSYALVSETYSSGSWSGSTTTLEAAGNNIAWPNGAYLSGGTKLALIWTQGAASPYSIEFDAVAMSSGVALSDTLAGVGTLSGALSAATVLSDTLAGVGTFSGSLSAATSLSDTLAGEGTLSGTLSAAVALSATFAGVGTLSASWGGAPATNAVLHVRSGRAVLKVRSGYAVLKVRQS